MASNRRIICRQSPPSESHGGIELNHRGSPVQPAGSPKHARSKADHRAYVHRRSPRVRHFRPGDRIAVFRWGGNRGGPLPVVPRSQYADGRSRSLDLRFGGARRFAWASVRGWEPGSEPARRPSPSGRNASAISALENREGCTPGLDRRRPCVAGEYVREAGHAGLVVATDLAGISTARGLGHPSGMGRKPN